jgi:beta-carotene 15,15'-dioxygenase
LVLSFIHSAGQEKKPDTELNGRALKNPPVFPELNTSNMDLIQKKGIVYYPVWNNWLLIGWGLLSLTHTYFIPVNGNIQVFLFLVTILLTGIPHGALDHLVEEKNSIKRMKKFSMIKFLMQYFFRMAVFALLWYYVPMASLALFLILSAYHFGETDLAKLPFKAAALKILPLSYGLMILSFLLLTHLSEVIPIINEIPQLRDSSFLLYAFEYRLVIIILISAITLALGLMFYWKDDHKDDQAYFSFTVQLICILWIMVSLPLILAFSFYFGCWHSLHALNNIRHHLSDHPNRPLDWGAMMRKSLPFSLAACVMIVALVIWAGNTYESSITMMGFFIGIAILTAPHLEIMSKMYRHLHD